MGISSLTILLIKMIVRNFGNNGSTDNTKLYNNCLEILTEDIFNNEAGKIEKQLRSSPTPLKEKLELHIDSNTEAASNKVLPRVVPTVDEMLARVKKVKNSVGKLPQKQYISEVSEVLLLLQESINNAKAENLHSEGKHLKKAVKKRDDLINDLQN